MPSDIDKIIAIFKKYYLPIPLEKYSRNPFKILVSTMLSARTKDELTVKVCDEKLFRTVSNFKQLSSISSLDIEKFIYPIGFYKTKARHLKKLSQILVENYQGKVPDTFEELIKLPGVGRKTANLVLNRAFGKPAISVDTHVHRISNLLKLVDTATPQQTEIELMKIIPKDKWHMVNKYFVSIGQQYRNTKKLIKFLESKGLSFR